MAAAVQFFFSYPETGRKSLEEIETMFQKGGPKPWKTKIGQSGLEARTASVAAESRKASVEADDSDKVSKEVEEKENIV